jgi:hypothetical protein
MKQQPFSIYCEKFGLILTLVYKRGEVQKRLRSRPSRRAGFSSHNFDIFIVAFRFLAFEIEMMPEYYASKTRPGR